MFNVGLIGGGFMGRMHAEVIGTLDDARLVCVCDKTLSKAEAIANLHGARSTADLGVLLNDPEVQVVDICLPTDLHAATAVRALEAGKHVICEKPMALSVEDADRMIDASKRTGKRLMIAHCIRFWPEYEYLERLVRDRSLGRLLSLNLTRYGAFPAWSTDQWLREESRAGGGALDMHIHDTDYALYLLGQPDESRSWGTTDEKGVSQIFTTMTFGDVIVHLEGGWNMPSSVPFKMAFRAIFEEGAAIFDDGLLTIYTEGNEPVVPEMTRMQAGTQGGNVSDLGGYYYELRYFFDRLRSGEPFDRITPESSRASLAVALDEIRQVKERMPVRVGR